jgi:proteasome lid subunit RPN8/RPN11
MALVLPDAVSNGIQTLAEAAYPHECCGALLGTETEQGREVHALLPLRNEREDSPRNRYSITARDVLRAESEARRQGLGLIGWFHSHPDHPAGPSEFDREHAWPWYSYVIVSVMAGVSKELLSWRLTDDRGSFLPEQVESHREIAGAAAQ